MEVCEGVAGVGTFAPYVTDSPEYRHIHSMLFNLRNSAICHMCIQCGERAEHWAWQHGQNPSLIDSYEPMCAACHTLYDGSGAPVGNQYALGGTHMRGSGNHQAKLTESDVLEIRRLRALGYRQVVLAEMYGVDRRVVNDITARRSWKHI